MFAFPSYLFPMLSALLVGILGPLTPPSVIVTGATGGTGSLLYKQLKADPRVGMVRAFIYNTSTAHEDAQKILNCTICDASEGIYYGDVTVPATLTPAFAGVDTVAIAVGAPGGSDEDEQKAIEFIGVENQVKALVASGSSPMSENRVVLCSSMGTTDPNPKPFMGGPILFWKLNAEAFLMSSGIGNVIVKPCGIEGKYGPGEKELIVGHDDTLPHYGAISRLDVARVMAEAVAERASGLRFDICIGKGEPTTDLSALLVAARWPWQSLGTGHGDHIM